MSCSALTHVHNMVMRHRLPVTGSKSCQLVHFTAGYNIHVVAPNNNSAHCSVCQLRCTFFQKLIMFHFLFSVSIYQFQLTEITLNRTDNLYTGCCYNAIISQEYRRAGRDGRGGEDGVGEREEDGEPAGAWTTDVQSNLINALCRRRV